MKKRITIIAVSLALICLSFAFAACGLDESSKEAVGTYNLTSITGIPGVSASSYDYNRIILKSNKTYMLENKVNGIETKQTGKWELDGNTLKMTTTVGATSVTDTCSYSDGKITITTNQQGYDVTLVLTKE